MHAVERDGALIIMGEVVNEDTVPGFVVSNLKATVINPPQTVCGGVGSTISNSQISLAATLTLSVPAYKKCGLLDLGCVLVEEGERLGTGFCAQRLEALRIERRAQHAERQRIIVDQQ